MCLPQSKKRVCFYFGFSLIGGIFFATICQISTVYVDMLDMNIGSSIIYVAIDLSYHYVELSGKKWCFFKFRIVPFAFDSFEFNSQFIIT